MNASIIIQLTIAAVCLLALVIMVLSRKDESCNPKCCANCKHHSTRRVRLSCEKCIQSRELPNWEKNDV